MQSNDGVAGDGSDREVLGGALSAWLRDHSLAAAALGISLLAAAGYCVQRSWLLGWYQAAGVPAFAHGWSVQDVIMLGVINLEVWLHGLVAIAVTGAMLYLEFVAAACAEKWIDRKLGSSKKRRQEGGAEKVRSKMTRNLIGHASVCAMFVAGAALVYCSILLMVYLFSAQPRRLGHEQYLEMKQAAETSIRAARKRPMSDAPSDQDAKVAHDYMLSRYGYVQVTVGIGESAERQCGWLVLQNGEHLLLFTRNGPLFLSAAGLGFSWTPTSIDNC